MAMSVLEAADEPLAKLSRAEKAQVLQWAARDLGGVFRTPESQKVPEFLRGQTGGFGDAAHGASVDRVVAQNDQDITASGEDDVFRIQ